MNSLDKVQWTKIVCRLDRQQRYFGIAFGAALLFAVPTTAMAQVNTSPNAGDTPQTEWVHLGTDVTGTTRPAKCDPQTVVQQLVAYCVPTSNGFFWRWYDFDVHTCQPGGETFRTIEYTRTTGARCDHKAYEQSTHHWTQYGAENWNPSKLDLDKVQEGTSASAPPAYEKNGDGTEKRNPGRTATAEDLPKQTANTPKTEKTETPKAERTVTPKTNTEKVEKHPRKHVTKKSGGTHARRETETSQTGGGGISIGIGLGGLGGFGGHGRGGGGRSFGDHGGGGN